MNMKNPVHKPPKAPQLHFLHFLLAILILGFTCSRLVDGMRFSYIVRNSSLESNLAMNSQTAAPPQLRSGPAGAAVPLPVPNSRSIPEHSRAFPSGAARGARDAGQAGPAGARRRRRFQPICGARTGPGRAGPPRPRHRSAPPARGRARGSSRRSPAAGEPLLSHDPSGCSLRETAIGVPVSPRHPA